MHGKPDSARRLKLSISFFVSVERKVDLSKVFDLIVRAALTDGKAPVGTVEPNKATIRTKKSKLKFILFDDDKQLW